MSFTILAMVVLGGMGNIWGVAVGAFIIYTIQVVFLQAAEHVLRASSTCPILKDINFLQYQFLLYGLALVLMMLFRPEGLFPSRRRRVSCTSRDDVGRRRGRDRAGRRSSERRAETTDDDDARARPDRAHDRRRADVLLSARNITKRFGGLVAVNDITSTSPTGSIVSLIGPNGAGKTTFFNIIAGIYDPTAGSIEVSGRRMIAQTVRGLARAVPVDRAAARDRVPRAPVVFIAHRRPERRRSWAASSPSRRS